jgi:hypothetical protein
MVLLNSSQEKERFILKMLNILMHHTNTSLLDKINSIHHTTVKSLVFTTIYVKDHTENSNMMNIGDIHQNQLIQYHLLPLKFLNQNQKNHQNLKYLKNHLKKNGPHLPLLQSQKMI